MQNVANTTTVAATQMACDWDIEGNIERAETMLRRAAAEGANVVLLQELFETPYFCPDQKQDLFALARPLQGHPTIERMCKLAAELRVVLPVSVFEKANNAYYNSVVVIDTDGTRLGHYRKSHIPDGPGYQEKFYFNPGDTGFRVWTTRHGVIGVGICWDQWFPECARVMALLGADLLLYPTAIGSEPQDPTINSKDHWQRVMQGHAAANMVALAASNRIGQEISDSATMTFYGHSFVAGPDGAIVAEANGGTESIAIHAFDFEQMRLDRAAWGLFRDRRPDLYQPLLTRDGRTT